MQCPRRQRIAPVHICTDRVSFRQYEKSAAAIIATENAHRHSERGEAKVSTHDTSSSTDRVGYMVYVRRATSALS